MGENKIVQPVRYFLSLAFLGGGGGLLLYLFFSGSKETQLLAIEPNQYVHEVPVLEGESVTIPLHIVSKTSNTIRVQKISASCGCAGLFADDDRPIAPSFDIHGKESIPMKASSTLTVLQETGLSALLHSTFSGIIKKLLSVN
ncbi:hypothetical protein FACS1894170_07360 [Planctomycetales bacterium]|nr:hypothetical protein FACS1894170_07360 [Planctomycetales bacterium]